MVFIQDEGREGVEAYSERFNIYYFIIFIVFIWYIFGGFIVHWIRLYIEETSKLSILYNLYKLHKLHVYILFDSALFQEDEVF